MSLMNPFFRRGVPMWGRALNSMLYDLERFENQFDNHWRENMDKMFVGDVTKQPVTDPKKFAVFLDVSHFKPEEIQVKLDGKVLSVEGKQEEKSDNETIHRSFSRSWVLPDNVDLSKVQSSLSSQGHLSIEAPKKEGEEQPARTIPIMSGGDEQTGKISGTEGTQKNE